MIRHLVLLDASALCEGDVYMRDTLLGMGYGLYPMCVQYNETTASLVFRRGILHTERDKSLRLSVAADELQALPAVRWYQEQQQQIPHAQNIHVHGPTISVSWSLGHDAAVHARLIPDLIKWTQWTHNDAWARMQQSVSGHTDPHVVPRHIRVAQTLEWVVAEKRRTAPADHPPKNSELLLLCKQTIRRLQANSLEVTLDPTNGTIVNVADRDPINKEQGIKK
jgi:hypothetical protein